MAEPERTLAELDVESCYRLLASVEIGRVAVAPEAGPPLVVPVTYVVDGETIVFRSAAGAKLLALREQPASFQVDVIDPFHRTGWSVLVQGVAEEIPADDDLALRPWFSGELRHWVRIVPAIVTGRHLHLPSTDGDDRPPRGYV